MSDGWVCVKDRLPGEMEGNDSFSITVLLTDGNAISTGYCEFPEDYKEFYYSDEVCWVAHDSDSINACCSGWAQPTHWMELPDLPDHESV